MDSPPVLLVREDLPKDFLRRLEKHQDRLEFVPGLQDAARRLRTQSFPLIVFNHSLLRCRGLKLLSDIRREYPIVAILILQECGGNSGERCVGCVGEEIIQRSSMEYVFFGILKNLDLISTVDKVLQLREAVLHEDLHDLVFLNEVSDNLLSWMGVS